MVFLVTGGCGFFGSRLVQELLRRGAKRVHAFDLRKPDLLSIQDDVAELYKERVKYFHGDVRKYSDVRKATQEVDVVFHIASYGMSGREMLDKQKIYEINVNGTQNLLKAAAECGASRFVYTSTYNVVFIDQPLVNAEDPPYPPLDRFCDEYSKTKSIAERIVREANGKPLATCALRAAGIYGDGEERHFPRILQTLQKGLYKFNIGSPDSLVEWVYVDNLVHAHILAAQKLGEPNSPVAGKAYPISDQRPINNFEFMRPFVEGLGYTFPSIWVPTWLLLSLAFLGELLHRILRPVYAYQPFLTRTEVRKCAVTHYFSPRRVQEELGYRPVVAPEEGMRRMVEFFRQRKEKKTEAGVKSRWSDSRTWLIALAFVLIAYHALAILSGSVPYGI